MKALQLRSPIHLYYQDVDLDKVSLRIYVDDDASNFDVTTSPDYDLNVTAINNEVTAEVAELIRSQNHYLFQPDFYETKDTAKYVLIQAILRDDTNTTIETKYNLIRVRDGYVDRSEDVQILNNEITTNINDWTAVDGATITSGQADAFGWSEAFETSAIELPISLEGTYTFSFFITNFSGDFVTNEFEKRVFNDGGTFEAESCLVAFLNEINSVEFGTNNNLLNNVISFDGTEFSYEFKPLSLDVFEFNGWYKISVTLSLTSATELIIQSSPAFNFTVFNPVLIKGNWLHITAEELLLQSNNTIFGYQAEIARSSIIPQVVFDRKVSEGLLYEYDNYQLGAEFEAEGLTKQSIVRDAVTDDLIYQRTGETADTYPIVLNGLCEPKYEPTKISFVNKFGVIQDVVFFKKRVDNVRTKEDNYKANILQGGQTLSHVGQKQILNKSSNQNMKISSGFYPESFNNVFKELLNSLLYWVDDEPAVLKSTNWTEKTSVNDKLINYDFDFEYGNNEINNIR